MQAGPKRTPTAPPLDLRRLRYLRRAERCIAFVERFLVVPKGHGALGPVRLREWQKEIIRGVFAPGVRQGLVSMPRGNGKTALAAFLSTYALFADGEEGARVFTVASDERQARFCFDTARRMIELNPALAEQVQFFSDGIRIPRTDGLLAPLPASARALQGTDPSFVVVDELAVVGDDTFEAMALASGKRARSLLLAISTAPLDPESAMFRLREHGTEGDDASFYFREWTVPAGTDADDERGWELANPALDDFLARDALRSTLKTTREASFRRYRLNEMVTDEGAWLPWGAWDALAAPRPVPPGSRVVLGFDGSVSGDSTALVLATVEERPHVALMGLWERPEGAQGWRVPRHEVAALVDAMYATFDVVELAADPAYWRSEIEAWALVHPGVVEFPMHVTARMAPATDRAYVAIAEGNLSHDGDERLARHVRNCVVRSTPLGDMVGKVNKDSARRVDAAVSMIVALDRAAWHQRQPVPRRRVFVG